MRPTGVARGHGGAGGRQTAARLHDVLLGSPTLEDVFIHLTGRVAAMTVTAGVERARGPGASHPGLARHPARRSRRYCAAISSSPGVRVPFFLAQVILQPLFLLFVFGRVLSELGYAKRVCGLLFPGLVAFTAF